MHDNLLRFGNNPLGLEQGAIKHCCLVLTTFSTYVKVKLGCQRFKVRLECRNSLAKMLALKSHAASLDKLRVYSTLNHLIKKRTLLLQPKI